MTIVEELLYRGWAHVAGFTLAGFWYLPRPPFGCVTCGGGCVMLWCDLKLATGYVDSGMALLQTKVSYCLCLAQGCVV